MRTDAFAAAGIHPDRTAGRALGPRDPRRGCRAFDGPALFFASIIPPTSNGCDAGGRGYLNALDAFTGTSLKNPFFDTNGDGVFDERDRLTNGAGDTVATGLIDPGIGMLTRPIIIRGPGRAIAVVGGSLGGKPIRRGRRRSACPGARS